MIIEKTIIDYLSTALTVPVTAERAIDPPAKYVLIERTAGGEQNHISYATIAIQTYAPSMYEAASLLEDVIDAMHGLIALDVIGSCTLSASYNYTDVAEHYYRYQAVYNVTYYREDNINGNSN